MTRLTRFAFGALALCAAALPADAALLGDAVYRPDTEATVQRVQYSSHYHSHRYRHRHHYSHRYRHYDRGAYRR